MLVVSPSKLIVNPGASLEPLRSTHFEFEVQGPSGVGKLPNTSEINLLLRDVSGLDTSIQVDQYAPNNTALNIPTCKSPNNPVQLSYMMADGEAFNKLLSFWTGWRKLVYQYQQDLMGLYGNIIGNGSVFVRRLDGQGGVEVKLYEIWPSGLSIPGLSRENSGDPARFTVTLQTAHVEFELVGSNQPSGNIGDINLPRGDRANLA